MKIRNCLASLTLVLWSTSGQTAAGPLARLVRTYRDAPTPLHRSAVSTYAAAHPKEAPLAALALGIVSYEQRDYTSAITLLQPIAAQVPSIADYAAYYLAAARVEAAQYDAVAPGLAPVRRESPASPMAARSWILEARALEPANPEAAIKLLRGQSASLPQPDADITLGDCYLAANQLKAAAEAYQRVYYTYSPGDASTRAAAGIALLKEKMGPSYPEPSSELLLRHAGVLLDSRDYIHAKAEYALLGGDTARVRSAAADYLRGETRGGCTVLEQLTDVNGEVDAERLYYLVECGRRQNDDAAMASALERLGSRYPQSPWRLRALNSAANRYVLTNRPADFVPLFRSVYKQFPTSQNAPLAHWKVAFQSWLAGGPDARDLLKEQLREYPGTTSLTGGALYFLGRSFEQAGDYSSAHACYLKLQTQFENHYYALLARKRLKASEIANAPGSPSIGPFLSSIKFPPPPQIPETPTAATATRVQRAQVLRSAGLYELAESELRFGAGRDCQPAIIAMEMASESEATHQGLRVMKSMNPDYLNLPITAAPRKFWELLFPLPYKPDLMKYAQDRDLDPYLLAGLIRQESEFNPAAVSRAKAYGLTQIRPGTGRQFARRAGVSAFSTRLLSEPGPNLKIGSTILRSMLEAQGQSVEQTLAAYNAGPARVTEWLTWANYREPAEFVENIPFTETRDYVQTVMRNAEMYRRLYGGQ